MIPEVAGALRGRSRQRATLEPQPRAPTVGDSDVIAVHLLGVPLKILQRVREHHGELMREIAYVSLDPVAMQALPLRLRELIPRTGLSDSRPYGGAVVSDSERDRAGAGRPDCADLNCTITRAEALRASAFWADLDEVGQYGRNDGLLLTLGIGELERTFLTWYFAQFVSQASGTAPAEWPGPTQ